MIHPPDLSALLRDPTRVAEIPIEAIPPLVMQLAALQSAMAVRLMLAQENAASNPDDRLLGIEEATRKLGVSMSWLYRRSSALSFVVRMGRKLMFSEQGIDRYIKQRSGRA